MNYTRKKNVSDEGYIKFKCDWEIEDCIAINSIKDLNFYRSHLLGLGLIGTYKDGTSFGNISKRADSGCFIISGTNTGSLEILETRHFSLVTYTDIDNNAVICRGLCKASSESMTHAVIYETLPWVNAVIHVHNPEAYGKLYGRVPQTPPEAEYGTPELASEVIKLLSQEIYALKKFFLIAGHADGLISFGESCEEAYQIMIARIGRD